MFEDKSFEVHSPPFIEVVKISRFKDIFSFKPCLGLEKPIKSTFPVPYKKGVSICGNWSQKDTHFLIL